jgi:hypothetical protein
MFVTSAEQRAGLLVAVVSGGRPALKERPTRKYLDDLRAAGFPVIWSVDERDAPRYERDDHEVSAYSHDWAYEYALRHWMHAEPPARDGFLGAFAGREWAAQEAERRGCWGWLNLDDNIDRLSLHRATSASFRTVREGGGPALIADILGALTLSTNAWITGAALEAVNTSRSDATKLIRPGFPYSFFVERVGPGREPWVGPFEDDIMQAFQYGDRADGVTSALVPWLRYHKEPKSKTGFRPHYDSTRSVQLQRLMPQGAKLSVIATKSNGRGGPRVFHRMPPGAIRNPVIVRDRDLYAKISARRDYLTAKWYEAEKEGNRAKVRSRLAKITASPTDR